MAAKSLAQESSPRLPRIRWTEVFLVGFFCAVVLAIVVEPFAGFGLRYFGPTINNTYFYTDASYFPVFPVILVNPCLIFLIMYFWGAKRMVPYFRSHCLKIGATLFLGAVLGFEITQQLLVESTFVTDLLGLLYLSRFSILGAATYSFMVAFVGLGALSIAYFRRMKVLENHVGSNSQEKPSPPTSFESRTPRSGFRMPKLRWAEAFFVGAISATPLAVILQPVSNLGYFGHPTIYTIYAAYVIMMLADPILAFTITYLWGAKRGVAYFRDHYLRIGGVLLFGTVAGFAVTALLLSLVRFTFFPFLWFALVHGVPIFLLSSLTYPLTITFVGLSSFAIAYFRHNR